MIYLRPVPCLQKKQPAMLPQRLHFLSSVRNMCDSCIWSPVNTDVTTYPRINCGLIARHHPITKVLVSRCFPIPCYSVSDFQGGRQQRIMQHAILRGIHHGWFTVLYDSPASEACASLQAIWLPAADEKKIWQRVNTRRLLELCRICVCFGYDVDLSCNW